ncbi:MAG: MurR/RpiR family transcriptional regulator [Anaerofustis stercorihominis]|nr:MurR/RpiR family transcriptional regulator [Anaerofustis stercorihominis]
MGSKVEFDGNSDVIKRIHAVYAKLSKQHKNIADYITGNLEKASYMTINILAEHTSTSVATVLRLTTLLGYEGYPEFRQALKNSSKSALTTLQRIDMPGFEKYGFESIREVLRHDMQNIKDTVDELDADEFDNVIDAIMKAKTVYLMASRTSSFLVEYLAYYLNLLLGGNVKIANGEHKEPLEVLMHATKDDAVVVLSFPRYSSETVKSLEFVKKKSPKIIGITDLTTSPIYPFCDHVLLAKSNIISFVDTLIAPLSLLNAIIIGVGLKDKERTRAVYTELETLWSENEIYK